MIPAVCGGTASELTGPGGRASNAPSSFAPSTGISASANGSAEASTHVTQRRIGCPRRRARAMPSIVAARTGTISASTNRRIAQAGTTLPENRRYADGAGTAGPPSSALIVCSAARPIPAIRSGLVGSSAAGARSPETDISTAGWPSAPNGPCSVAVNGNARCANCPPMLGATVASWACCASALAAVFRSTGGATT